MRTDITETQERSKVPGRMRGQEGCCRVNVAEKEVFGEGSYGGAACEESP